MRPTPPSPRFVCAGATHVGTRRSVNEDGFALDPAAGLAVVLDGLGGMTSGAGPVELLRAEVLNALRYGHDAGVTPAGGRFDRHRGYHEQLLVGALQHAGDRLYEAARREMRLRGSGATVVALAAAGGELVCVAHAGDARAYRVRPGTALEPLTEDHTLANEYVRVADPPLTPAQIAELPAHVITRALGMAERVKVDTRLERVVRDDTFLLCTDGLYLTLPEAEILATITACWREPARACDELIHRANARGTDDNLTAVLVRVTDVIG